LAFAATALTIVIFPFNYDGLMRLEAPIVLLVNVRNLVLAGLTASVLWRLRPSALIAIPPDTHQSRRL
jgi:hypothetical protein